MSRILKEVRKCFKLEEKCKDCKIIQKGGEVNNNNIILYLLNDYENKYNKIINKYIIHI